MPATNEWAIGDATVRVMVSSRETAGRYTICEVEIPGPGGPPLHTHQYEDGFFYVLDGEFTFEVGDEIRTAPPGTSLFIPRQTAYSFENRGTAPGRFLVLALPGGLDLFIQDLGTLARQGAAVSREKLAQVLDKHGISLSASRRDQG